jgi:hypothetical protein
MWTQIAESWRHETIPARPVDPVPFPESIREAGVRVGTAALATVPLLLVITNDPDGSTGLAAALVALDVLAILVSGCMVAAATLIGRRRLGRYERVHGFLPRRRRRDLPPTGRTTLFRVEYGSRGGEICLMVARWAYREKHGWRREEEVDWTWIDDDDPAELGAERARLSALAERLEEEADDERLEREGAARLAREARLEYGSRRRGAKRLAAELARDPR